MRKIFGLFAAVLMTISVSAASYGILVNGKMYYAGEKTSEFEGFTQYLAHVPLKNGDYCQLYDKDNKAAWGVKLNTASVQGITYDEATQRYNVTKDGCYDCYIKLKYQHDELYIGGGSNCGEGEDISGGTNPGGNDPGTDPGTDPGDDEDVNYYAIGWINGADHGEAAYDTFEDEYLFENGKLTIDCKMGSYIAIKDHMGNFYYSKTQTTIENTSVTMDWASGWQGCQKWAIPEGVNYIIIRSSSYKNKLVLERVDKATYDAYSLNVPSAIDHTAATDKARKVVIDGQLRIVRGGKIFDATGRQL